MKELMEKIEELGAIKRHIENTQENLKEIIRIDRVKNLDTFEYEMQLSETKIELIKVQKNIEILENAIDIIAE